MKNFTKTAELLTDVATKCQFTHKKFGKRISNQLFQRSPKSLKITPTGDILYDRAKQIITIYEQTKQDILEHHQYN